MTEKKLERLLLVAIVIGYWLVGGLFAVLTPDWQTPDEPAHYNYVAQVATGGCCPVIEVGDWDSPYLEELKSAQFQPDLLDKLDTVQYEDHQPPLYYLLASVVFSLTGGSLAALRLFSVLMGTGIVLSAYAISKVMLPDHPPIALGTTALVAFLPQHIAIIASVNNDVLGWTLTGITLLATVLYLKDRPLGKRPVTPLLLGLLVGVGLITKASTYFLAGLVPLAILLKWWANRTPEKLAVQQLIRDGVLFLIPALILGFIWWGRNIGVYGFPDFLGLGAHDKVVADQLRTADRIAQLGFGAYLSEALQTTFHSFWGQFGWMALPMPGWVYSLFGLLMVAGISGLAVDPIIKRGETAQESDSGQRLAWWILWLTVLLAIAQYFYYNSEFYQVQGRYMFGGLIPFALLLTLGVDAWRRWLLARFAWAKWGITLLYLPLAALDVYLLWRFIVPWLSA